METHIFKIDPWKIIEAGWNRDKIKDSESIFSIGNGAMGQREVLTLIERSTRRRR